MPTPSQNIDQYIAKRNDWRSERIAAFRKLINETNSGLEESWKWNAPVWTYNGKNALSLSAFKHHIKIVFFEGAALHDPDGLFNSGIDAKKTRTINLEENDTIDETALRKLIESAVNYLQD